MEREREREGERERGKETCDLFGDLSLEAEFALAEAELEELLDFDVAFLDVIEAGNA
jgi:hypothetical protein